MALEKLQTIRPFTCWAKYCLDDLHLAHQLITTHQFIEAKTVINRLVEAMKLRLLDFELEELIAEIGLAILLQSPDGSEYSTKITELIEQFKAIDETGFQEPVCQSRVLPSLRRAKAAIKAKQWLEAKKLLKQAVAPI